MSQYWSRAIKNIEPYTPGEQPQGRKFIKLNTNENPYPPSPLVIEAIKRATNDSLRLYPDPYAEELRTTIAGYYGLNNDQVFVGNGSDELLAFAFLAFFDPEEHILFPDVTYSFYPVYSALFRINYELIPLNDDFTIPVQMFEKKNGGVIFPNPNAPTGICLDCREIETILENNMKNVVVVDEAYIDFGGESALKLLGKYRNLLIIRTLSKSRSLAGMRIGFALAHKDLIEGLDRVKSSFNSYTLDRLALAAAKASFEDEAYFQETRSKIIKTREKVLRRLIDLNFRVIPSKANFLFISHPAVPAVAIYQELKARGILVRHFNKPRIDNFLRVSIGSDEEMDAFLRYISLITLP